MASDPYPDAPWGDSDSDRFQAGCNIARTQLEQLSRIDASYADAFSQQIGHARVDGRVRASDRSIPPVDFTTRGSIAEGLALRRLDHRSSFGAVNGFDPTTASTLVDVVSRGGQATVAPHYTAFSPSRTFRSDGATYLQAVIDCIVSVVDSVQSVTARLSSFLVRKALANTLGFDETQERVHTELFVQLETSRGEMSATWVSWDSTAPAIDPSDAASHFSSRPDLTSEAIVQVPDHAAVLLPAGWGGVWMHEAVGHPLEADTYFRPGSPLENLLGRRVAGESLTIVNDGTLSPSRVAAGFDDEGVETGLTPLIENGIVTGLMTDRRTASIHGLPLTGNGRRPHFGLPPRPRMSNLVLKACPTQRDELLGLADPLIVVGSIRHGRVETFEGLLHLEVEEAALYHEGHVVGQTGPIVISVSPRDVFDNIIGIADDLCVDLHRGYCVKDGSALPVTIAQPSVLVGNMPIRAR